jgi:hypothetical protein
MEMKSGLTVQLGLCLKSWRCHSPFVILPTWSWLCCLNPRYKLYLICRSWDINLASVTLLVSHWLKNIGCGHGQRATREALLLPWQDVAMDLIGPWTLSIGRNKKFKFHALTIIDTMVTKSCWNCWNWQKDCSSRSYAFWEYLAVQVSQTFGLYSISRQ